MGGIVLSPVLTLWLGLAMGPGPAPLDPRAVEPGCGDHGLAVAWPRAIVRAVTGRLVLGVLWRKLVVGALRHFV